MSRLFLGVEIGGTKQQVIVGNENGEIVDMISERFPLPNGAKDVLDWMEKKIPILKDKYPTVERIGVGFGGPMASTTGKILISVQVPGWKDFELNTWFTEKFNLPTVSVVDTVAGGYAELHLGAGRGSKIFFYSNIGTGIGGALYINGKTFDGTGNGGMYFGNTFVSDWTASEPGKVEKIENLCSGTAIERRLRTPGYVPKDSMLMELCGGDFASLNCKQLKVAAEAEDKFALEELDRIGYSYGQGLATVISLIGPDKIAIGGGVANMGEVLVRPMRKYADQYVFISGKGTYTVEPCELMDNNVPVGAVLYARDGFNAVG